MFVNLRRQTRKNIILPATAVVRHRLQGNSLTKTFTCHINNISRQGACISMTQVMDGNFHIFHSTREDANLLLELEIRIPPDDRLLTINAVPIWYNLLQNEQRREFAMGVEFTELTEEQQIKGLEAILSL